MTEDVHPEIEFEHDDFNLGSLEDEIRVDERCQDLLKHFYLNLISSGMSPQRASELAFSADLYVRDYVLDFARQNVVRPQPGIVRRFAATWYVIRTLDPEMELLERHLTAICELYGYLHRLHLISAEELRIVEEETANKKYYRSRIESFLAISGDGYFAWEAECPLK
jgi:hypothetical protein